MGGLGLPCEAWRRWHSSVADPGLRLWTLNAEPNVSRLHEAALKGVDRAGPGPMHVYPLKRERTAL